MQFVRVYLRAGAFAAGLLFVAHPARCGVGGKRQDGVRGERLLAMPRL